MTVKPAPTGPTTASAVDANPVTVAIDIAKATPIARNRLDLRTAASKDFRAHASHSTYDLISSGFVDPPKTDGKDAERCEVPPMWGEVSDIPEKHLNMAGSDTPEFLLNTEIGAPWEIRSGVHHDVSNRRNYSLVIAECILRHVDDTGADLPASFNL